MTYDMISFLMLSACKQGCKKYETCNAEKDKGFWVDVKYFQLGGVRIPTDVSDRYLKALTLKEDVLREEFMQQAAVVRKETVAAVWDFILHFLISD